MPELDYLLSLNLIWYELLQLVILLLQLDTADQLSHFFIYKFCILNSHSQKRVFSQNKNSEYHLVENKILYSMVLKMFQIDLYMDKKDVFFFK